MGLFKMPHLETPRFQMAVKVTVASVLSVLLSEPNSSNQKMFSNQSCHICFSDEKIPLMSPPNFKGHSGCSSGSARNLD